MIARVFPRKTNASPDDKLAFFDVPGLFRPVVQKVHVSVTFSGDLENAEELARQWEIVAPVEIGGPALGDPGGDFTPGRYLKKGYVITSRGCPNKCWFCDAWKREGAIRELPITNGLNVLDSNLLACSKPHVKAVFKMLAKQKGSAEFTGGLEAARLTWDSVNDLWDLRPKSMFFAYDTPDDLEPLIEAGKKLRYADFTRHHMKAYVLVGYEKDTLDGAESRLTETWAAGFMPMAMVYHENTDVEWKRFQRLWCRPAIIKKRLRQQILPGIHK